MLCLRSVLWELVFGVNLINFNYLIVFWWYLVIIGLRLDCVKVKLGVGNDEVGQLWLVVIEHCRRFVFVLITSLSDWFKIELPFLSTWYFEQVMLDWMVSDGDGRASCWLLMVNMYVDQVDGEVKS